MQSIAPTHLESVGLRLRELSDKVVDFVKSQVDTNLDNLWWHRS